MITLQYSKKGKFTLPQSLNELNEQKYIRIAAILFTGLETLDIQVRVLRILSGLSPYRWLMLKPEAIERALPYVQWVFEAKRIAKQLIPKFNGYYGPASGFDNLRMNEFHLSELYYKQCLDAQDGEETEAINNLIAVLYRQGKPGYDIRRDPDGDIRVPFNHNEIPFHAKRIARWPLDVKYAIFLWYASCRAELEEANPLVFSDTGSDGYISQFDTGLYGMMRSLAGDKLGPVEKVEDMHVHTAMLELGLMREEEKHIEEQIKSNS